MNNDIPTTYFFGGEEIFHRIISLTMYFENVSNYHLRVPFIELAKGPRRT